MYFKSFKNCKERLFIEEDKWEENDIKGTLKIINSVTNKSNKDTLVRQLKKNKVQVEDKSVMVEYFNYYFVDIGHNIARCIFPLQTEALSIKKKS